MNKNLDFCIHYNPEIKVLYIEPEYEDGEVYKNVSPEEIPEKVKLFLQNLLTNN